MNPEQVWTDICARYAIPERAAVLLQLQDQQGLDVVLELFCECAQAQGHGLSAEAKLDAATWVAHWRAQVVLPLRQLRRAMKPLQSSVSETAEISAQIQQAELQAERTQVRLLCDWLDSYLARSAAADAAGC